MQIQHTEHNAALLLAAAHQGTQQHSITAVIGCSVSRCAIQMHQQWQMILQMHSACNLELLPSPVINCDTLSVFKSRLKTHLYNTAYI